MKNKKERLQAIIEIVKTQVVGSQEEMASMLASRGYNVTQATLSRDLKTLKVSKIANDNGSYMYIMPDTNHLQDSMLLKSTKAQNIRNSTFISFAMSGNVAVIRTRNGYAAGVAFDLDMVRRPEVLGTIAGSDTVFVLMREDVSKERTVEILSEYLPINEL